MRLNSWPGNARRVPVNAAKRKGSGGDLRRMNGKVRTFRAHSTHFIRVPAAVLEGTKSKGSEDGRGVHKNEKDTILPKLTTAIVTSSQEYNGVICKLIDFKFLKNKMARSRRRSKE